MLGSMNIHMLSTTVARLQQGIDAESVLKMDLPLFGLLSFSLLSPASLLKAFQCTALPSAKEQQF
jgi:hypothetical protein